MIIIFSILFFSSIFTTSISGFKDPNLPEDFFSKWENSQVFIYYKMRFSQKFQSEYPYPNCFGNLLTAKLVLTATSCFIHLKGPSLYYVSKFGLFQTHSTPKISIYSTESQQELPFFLPHPPSPFADVI